jgi:hypothetical protein
MVIFYDVTRRLLNQRLELARQGQLPPFTDIRHFFYECRNVFLRENPQLTEIDSKSKMLYVDWQIGALNQWSVKQCGEFGIPKELYWRVREKINIWAEGKAVCEGESGKFLVDKETRSRTAKDCSFILLCEKKTVSKELLERLKAEGYKVNLVSTGGYSPSDVQEAVLQIAEELDEEDPTFYFLVLHDFDLEGVKIFFNLRERYAGVIDVGVNSELIKYLNEQGNFDSRLIEEQRLNKSLQNQLRLKIEENKSAYTVNDFQYLQGEMQPNGKEWIGKRIEIDAIHVQYGIEPFVKYILKKIKEECEYWDLTRIGITDFELEEPRNPFEAAFTGFNYIVSEKCNATWKRISQPLLTVDKFVAAVTSGFGEGFHKLKVEQGIGATENIYSNSGMQAYEANQQDIDDLKLKFQHGFEKKYAPDYTDELEELNDRIHSYDGDITTAINVMLGECADLQSEVNEACGNDAEATKFSEELDQIDWGEEEFDRLPIPDEKEVIRTVINRLQKWLEKLESQKLKEHQP